MSTQLQHYMRGVYIFQEFCFEGYACCRVFSGRSDAETNVFSVSERRLPQDIVEVIFA